MVRRILTPKQSLNKAYHKVTVFRDEFNLFRNNLTQLLSNIDHEESEENVKNHLKDFLNDTYYKDKHLLNTKNKTDLVIYLDKKQDSKAGVLIEVKRPANKGEMITKEDLNRKALHELILYYIQERIEAGNDEIKYLIATNIYEWFIFDAVLFENLFYKNTQLVKDYNKWKNNQKVSGNTPHFYNEIAKPFLDNLSSDITFTHFDLNEYKKLLNKTDKESERKFIPLYKILSPVHLLKQPFANDSNSLDRNFYNELLHIIGLEEVKVKNKKLINRKSIEERDPGSFIENTIQKLRTDQAIDRIKEPAKYGDQIDDQLYHIALELSLTWINRILFLKLLESQLFNYHKNDNYKFLNSKKISDFDELYNLFHEVLAVRIQEREGVVKDKYALVPYLNSSLFEISDLENQAFRISQLNNKVNLKIYKSTILKDKSGKKRTGTLTALEYLFEFLDAYNFTSEGKEEIEEEKKTLINASVLGLIFEKINGYKDGSYFTPGFITMYMCRETIRRAVVQKFNEKYEWQCETFEDLKNHLADRRNTKDILEENEVINSLKICDPAVGSGHFLVSALNEIIAIKSELGILADESGVVLSGYDVKIENDELIVTYNHGEELFEYHPPQKRATINQQVQETLFREKQTIIENCLFGVDINPNSVSIARLRLWIELLKNAYYTKESNYKELETLPNIDINIKEGNSLVSRFKLTEDIFTSADKTAFEIYKMNVNLYKNEHNREKRKQLKTAIDKTRERIKGIALNPVKELDDKISSLTEKLHELNKTDMFEEQKSKAETEKIEKKRSDLTTKLEKLIAERNSKIEEFKTLYSNAFEWRFEFPEVLDEDANFVGFDVVIGNPPWGDIFDKDEKEFLKDHFQRIDSSTPNAFAYFIGLTLEISNNNRALLLPDSILIKDFEKTRSILKDYLIQLHWYQNTDMPYDLQPFKDVEHDVSMIIFNSSIHNDLAIYKFYFDEGLKEEKYVTKKTHRIFPEYGNVYNLVMNDSDYLIKSKIYAFSKLSDLMQCHEGIHTGNIRHKLFKNSNLRGDEKPLFYGSKNGDIIMNYYAKRENWFVDYRKEIILKSNGEYASLRDEEIFKNPKIYITRTGDPFKAFIDLNSYASNNFFSLQFKDYKQNNFENLASILCVINSKFSQYFIRRIVAPRIGSTFIETKIIHLLALPLPFIDEKMKKKLVSMVNKIIKLKDKNIFAETTGLESQIDEIVYKLYGLTEEEIRIVEGK